MQIRTLDELVIENSTTWDEFSSLLTKNSANQVLEPEPSQAFDTLLRLQATTRSMLGAIALNTGAILADHGWFRLLGSGYAPDLPSIADANAMGPPTPESTPPGHLVIGFDVLGGQFAIDGGALGINPGDVCYFAPDSLEWEGLGGGYSAFVQAAVSGGLNEAFQVLRWEGWQADIVDLPLGMSLASYPPPFAAEGRDLSQTAKNPVPTTELLDFYASAAAQLNQHQPAQPSKPTER